MECIRPKMFCVNHAVNNGIMGQIITHMDAHYPPACCNTFHRIAELLCVAQKNGGRHRDLRLKGRSHAPYIVQPWPNNTHWTTTQQVGLMLWHVTVSNGDRGANRRVARLKYQTSMKHRRKSYKRESIIITLFQNRTPSTWIKHKPYTQAIVCMVSCCTQQPHKSLWDNGETIGPGRPQHRRKPWNQHEVTYTEAQ